MQTTSSDGFMINLATVLLTLSSHFTSDKERFLSEVYLDLDNPAIGLNLAGETMVGSLDEPESQTSPPSSPSTTLANPVPVVVEEAIPIKEAPEVNEAEAPKGQQKISEYFTMTLYSLHVGIVPCIQYYHQLLQQLSREMQKMKKMERMLAMVLRPLIIKTLTL